MGCPYETFPFPLQLEGVLSVVFQEMLKSLLQGILAFTIPSFPSPSSRVVSGEDSIRKVTPALALQRTAVESITSLFAVM